MLIAPDLAALLATAPTSDLHDPTALPRWAAGLDERTRDRLWVVAQNLAASQGRRARIALHNQAMQHGYAATAATWLAAAGSRGELQVGR